MNYTYENTILPYIDNYVVVTLSDEELTKVESLARRVANSKQNESHHIVDSNKTFDRFLTGFLGEMAVEKLLGISVVDWSVGDSKDYNVPDIKRYDIGVKTVEKGKFPIIFKQNYYNQIICIKANNNTIFVCGLATKDVLNKYQSDDLILDKNLKSRETKTGFYGFDMLKSVESIYDIIDYKIDKSVCDFIGEKSIGLFKKFKNREVKAKDIFVINEVDKSTAYQFVRQYHYLKDAKFFSKFAYGLFCGGELVGVATFSNPQGTMTMKSWFSLPNSDQSVLELSRLCMTPLLNGTNATSYLLGNSVKMLKSHDVKAVITLADASRHIGSIYQVCNFKYYGLTKSATDFFKYPENKKNPRGTPSSWQGVYLPRTRKHRYAYILDKSLKCNYDEQPHPKTKGVTIKSECCNDNLWVYDNRYDVYYTCPHCTGKLIKLNECDLNEECIKQIISNNNNNCECQNGDLCEQIRFF